jgi:hypothetical protein
MNKIVTLALLVGGVVLIFNGISATNSFSSDVSRLFTGSPTDKAIWMLIGGIVAAIAGLTMTLRGAKQNQTVWSSKAINNPGLLDALKDTHACDHQAR